MPGAEHRQSRTPPPFGQAVDTEIWHHPRRYALYSGSTLLGTSNLEFPVEPHTRMAGRFLPTSAAGHITAAFQLYGKAAAADDRLKMRRFVAERDKLGLELWDAGVRLEASVDLVSTWDDGTHMIHVTSTDSRLWRPRLFPD